MNGLASSVPAVRVEGVVKRFGATVALDGAGLEVPAGMVFGLLGPNGAGKTTLVRILATLLTPDAGRAEVFGLDVAGEPAAVRELIGLTGQFAAVDELLTGRENLEMFGRLFKLSREEARRRAGELLERFDLAQAADRPARTYSGGMRRRLDIASSLLTRPRVLFLDEPTTGLDPRSRNEIWAIMRELRRGGTTLLLTTQYLEEADQLADRIAVIDRGKVIAEGTGNELKDRVGGQILEVELSSVGQRDRAQAVLAGVGCGDPQPDERPDRLTLPAPRNGLQLVEEAAAGLRRAQIGVSDIGLRRPTLDDVFLQLTGAPPSEDGDGPGPRTRRREGRRIDTGRARGTGGAEARRDLEPVHVGQVDVEQDDVRALGRRFAHGRGAIGRFDHPEPMPFEEAPGPHAEPRVIVNHEDSLRPAGPCARGSSSHGPILAEPPVPDHGVNPRPSLGFAPS